MESYRLSSKIREQDHEYLIQTTNDGSEGTVLTTVFIDGVPAETAHSPHPAELDPQEILSFVKLSHDEKKKELETLLQAYQDMATSGDAQMLYHLGTAFFYKGLYRQALDLFSSVAALNPASHQALNHLAMTHLALGNVNDAVAVARRSVSERPGYPDYRNVLAEALLANNQVDEAIGELETALQTNMYYSDAYFNLGLALVRKQVNQPDAATLQQTIRRAGDCFHRASVIFSELQGDLFTEGMQALRNHDLVQALNIFRRIREDKKLRHRQEFASFYMKFIMHPDWVSEQALADRIKFLEEELKKNPSYVDMHAELAECYLEQARMSWKDGLDRLRKTAELNPSLERITDNIQQVEEVYHQLNRSMQRLSTKGK